MSIWRSGTRLAVASGSPAESSLAVGLAGVLLGVVVGAVAVLDPWAAQALARSLGSFHTWPYFLVLLTAAALLALWGLSRAMRAGPETMALVMLALVPVQALSAGVLDGADVALMLLVVVWLIQVLGQPGYRIHLTPMAPLAFGMLARKSVV